jgi:hypothetical protein
VRSTTQACSEISRPITFQHSDPGKVAIPPTATSRLQQKSRAASTR